MGAVGPSQVLVSVNGRIRLYDKSGNLQGLNLTDSAFWAPVRNGSEPTDPGVEYDRLSQRWIVSAINTENTNNRVMLAVSNGPTITDASSFTYYFFNEANPPPSGPARFVGTIRSSGSTRTRSTSGSTSSPPSAAASRAPVPSSSASRAS